MPRGCVKEAATIPCLHGRRNRTEFAQSMVPDSPRARSGKQVGDRAAMVPRSI